MLRSPCGHSNWTKQPGPVTGYVGLLAAAGSILPEPKKQEPPLLLGAFYT